MKMKESEKRNLAKRFTLDDWGWLCTNDEFTYALNNGTRAEAATLAALMLETRRQFGIWKGDK